MAPPVGTPMITRECMSTVATTHVYSKYVCMPQDHKHWLHNLMYSYIYVYGKQKRSLIISYLLI